MQFGNGMIGTPRTLIVAAGIDDYADGIIAAIRPVPATTWSPTPSGTVDRSAYSQRNR